MPVALTAAVRSYVSPPATGIGALVHVGEPASAALPPVPCSCAAREPSVPPLELDDAVPAVVLWPLQPCGWPADVCCSKSPFSTLLPLTVTVSVPALLSSSSSTTAFGASAVARI